MSHALFPLLEYKISVNSISFLDETFTEKQKNYNKLLITLKKTWIFINFERVLKYGCLIVLYLLWCIRNNKRVNLMSYVLFYYDTSNQLVRSILYQKYISGEKY